MDPKSEKCVLVGYSFEQKGYNCYNPRTKQVRVIRDFVFDESASCYLPSIPDLKSNPSSKDEVSEAGMLPDELEIGALEESLIAFRLSGPYERPSWHDHTDEEPASSADSAMQSPQRKPRRRLTSKEKGMKKLPEYGTDRDESDRHKSDPEKMT